MATASVYGGSGGDSMVFLAAVSDATIDAGADNDTLSFSSTFATSTLLAGAGDDTLRFTDQVSASKINLGTGNDQVTFSTLVGSSSSIVGAAGTSQTINFSAAADLVSFDGTFGAGSIMGGSGNDTLVFLQDAAVNASSVVKLEAGADSLVFNGNTVSGQFGAGAGDDYVGGSISVGTSGVSFWSGVGDDTFSFSTITNDGGTAYFWNEGGTDSIVLGGAVSSGGATGGGAPVVFGVTKGASMNISFAAGTINTSATTAFGAGTMSSSWSVANSNLVSFGFGSTMTTIIFSGGGLATLQGGVFETAAGTNIFDTAKASSGTGLFGIAGAIPTFS